MLLVADQGGGCIDWATADTLIAFRSRKPAKFAASLPVLSAPMSGRALEGVNRGVRIDLVADLQCRDND